MDLARVAAALRDLADAIEAPEGSSREPEPPRLYMTPDEYAARVHVQAQTIRRMIREEGMPSARVGRVLRIPVEKADRWMEERQSGARARRSARSAARRAAPRS